MNGLPFAIRRPVTMVMLFAGLTLLGFLSYRQLPVQLMPNYIYPKMWVVAVHPGASPEMVERDILIPVEGEIATLDGVEKIESQASFGQGVVTISYKPATDLKIASLRLEQKTTALKNRIPETASLMVQRFDSSLFSNFVMSLSLQGKLDPDRLRNLAEDRVLPRLQGIDGVVSARAVGGQRSGISVVMDPARLEAYGIPAYEVRRAIETHHRQRENLGYIGSGGPGGMKRFVTLEGKVETPSELENIPVGPRGKVLLKDVCSVEPGGGRRKEIFRINGMNSVAIYLQKDEESNLIATARRIRGTIAALNSTLVPEGVRLGISFDAAEYIEKDITRLKKLAVAGIGLAVLILFVFLRDLRSLLIIALAIPVSILVTFNFFSGLGLSLNIITMLGLAVSVGMLVDNSIVVLENIFRHLQKGKGRMQAAADGSREVFRAVLAGTLTTAVVFLPLLWIRTEFQALWKELTLSIVVPLFISLAAAAALVPMLSSRILGRKPAPGGSGSGMREPREVPFAGRTGNRALETYTLLLKSAARHPFLTTTLFFSFLVLTVLITTPIILYMVTEERKPLNRIDIRVEMPEGTSLESMDSVVSQIETAAWETGAVEELQSSIHSERDAYITVMLPEREKREGKASIELIRRKMKERTDTIREARIEYDRSQYSRGQASSDEDESNPFGAEPQLETVTIRGPETRTLARVSELVQNRLKEFREIDRGQVKSSLEVGAPEVQIVGNADALSRWNLTMRDLMTLVWLTNQDGERTTVPMHWRGEEQEIFVSMQGAEERSLADVSRFRVLTPEGLRVSIADLSRVRLDSGPATIRRVNRERQVKIRYAFDPRYVTTNERLENLRGTVGAALREMRLPPGYTFEVEQQNDAASPYKWMLYFGLFLVYLVLAVTFESFSMPFIILMTVPLAIPGVLWLLVLTGTNFELFVLFSLLVLLGIVVNNGIILIDYAQYLRREKGFQPVRAVVTSAGARIRPVFMTAGTTIFGMLPMALKLGGENEFWPPFAIAVIGGLLSSTLTTLVFVPVTYLSFGALARWLRSMGIRWVLLATAAAGASVYLLYFRIAWVERTAWRFLWLLPLWFGWLGLTSLLLRLFARSEGPARTLRALRQGTVRIEARNVTKIYGEDSRWLREWKKRARKDAHLRESGRPVILPGRVFSNVSWKLPVFGLLLYLQFYFESRFWLYAASWAAWGLLCSLLADAVFLLGRDPARLSLSRPRIARSPRRQFAVKLALAAATVLYAHFRIDATLTFTAVTSVVYAGIAAAVYTAGRIRREEIRPGSIGGRLGFLTRPLVRLLGSVPGAGGGKKEIVKALSRIRLEVDEGMLGLLGPNGAGKTTLMRLICNIYRPSRGIILLNGIDITKSRGLVQSLIGYLPQDFGLYEELTAEEFLEYHALLSGLTEKGKRRTLMERILEETGLAERKDSKLSTYSGGMKQRAGIARTLLHLPRIIVVDEPTAGLDPKERIRFRNLLSELSRERIVIFSTHIVEDIYGICNKVAVLHEGKLLFLGTPEAMRSLAEGKVFETVCCEDDFAPLKERFRIIAHTREADGGIRVRCLSTDGRVLPGEPATATLEDAYLYLLAGAA